MSFTRKFPFIPVNVPRHSILKRLGYNSNKTEISEASMDQIDCYINRAADLINLSGVSYRCGIEKICPDDGTCSKIYLKEEQIKIESSNLCRFLRDSDELIFMGVTGGKDVAEEIARLQEAKKMTEAVVIDAAAGEIVDEGFEWLASVFRRELSREALTLPRRRFSAGYGDFDIEFQRVIYELLKLDQLGIEITESCMLLPEKSVTAIYGIEKGTQNG